MRKVISIWLSSLLCLTGIVALSIYDTSFSLIESAAGSTLYVNTSGSGGAYTSIQDAIDAANPGDIIFVYNGTYNEHLLVNKTISLIGENRTNTIIDGGGSGNVIHVSADWVNITGFSIINSGSGMEDAGLKIVSNYNTISSNNASNNKHGIYLYHSEGNNISYNEVFDNWNKGIYLNSSTNNNVTGNNVSSGGWAIYLYRSSGNLINGNNASYNGQEGILQVYGYGVYLDSSNKNNISYNTFLSNAHYGIYLYHSSENEINGNIMNEDGIFIEGNLLEHWNTHNIDSSNTVNGKPIHYWKDQNGGTVPLGAGEVILANCSSVRIEDQELPYVTVGFQVGFSSNINITNNTFPLIKYYSIYLYNSSMNSIINNTFHSNKWRTSIHLYGSHDNNISYNDIHLSQMGRGIHLCYSNGNNITENTASDNGFGIYLSNSSGNNITGNNLHSNIWNGMSFYSDSNNNEVRDNEISDSYYGLSISKSSWNNVINNTVSNSDYGISLLGANENNIIDNVAVSNWIYGINLDSSDRNNIISNNASSNDNKGIYLDSSNDNNITGNNASLNTYDGIRLGSSCSNIITGNHLFSNNQYGIYFWKSSDNNSIIGNNASSNDVGIQITYESNNNTIKKNNITNNNVGICIYSDSKNNTIFYNNLINNTYSAEDHSNDSNQWDIGYPGGGNYWSDYTGIDYYSGPEQNISGSDHIGDTAYVIDLDSLDNYPLMEPFPGTFPPEIQLISPDNNSIIGLGETLNFYVSDWDLQHVVYSIDNGTEQMILPPYNISTMDWLDGIHEVIIKAKDTMENLAYKSFSFTSDFTKPHIFLNAPGNNSVVIQGAILDFSIRDLYLKHTNYSINGGDIISISEPFNVSTAGWSDGEYKIQINALDLVGNLNSSWSFFTIDSTPPTITLNNPGNNSVIQSGVVLDFSVMDPHLMQVNYSINGGANSSFPAPYDISTSGRPDGDYTIQIDATDVVDNSNSSWYLFTIDTVPPLILLNTPENNSIISGGTLLDFDVIDTNLFQVNYSVNGGTINSASEPFNISTAEWADGDYSIQINALDEAGNKNSSWFFFIIDSTSPAIVDVTVMPALQEVHGNVNISVNVSDLGKIETVRINVKDPNSNTVGNFTMAEFPTAHGYYLNQTYDIVGTYVFTIWASDSLNHWNKSLGTFVIQDTTPPTANAGANVEILQGVNVTFDGSASSDNSGIISNYTWTFTDIGSTIFLYGSNPTFKFVLIDNYTVMLRVMDSSGNSANDTIWVNVKGLDNDNDGLTDYDEENIYHTNPNMADTDNDGVNDGEEVEKGTNPLVADPKQRDSLSDSLWVIILFITIISVIIIGVLLWMYNRKNRKEPPPDITDKNATPVVNDSI